MPSIEIPPQWFPDHPPIYDIHKTYLENAEKGPFFNGPLIKRIFPPKEAWIDFLDTRIASPIGVPAGPLLNAKWVALAAQLGFDVLTYKTIRSGEHPAHPLPNMIYVNTEGMLILKNLNAPARHTLAPDRDIEHLAVTNSFGMPSRSPEYLLEDIAKAQGSLQDGQVLIVSIVGSVRPSLSFVDDFIAAARLAKEAGARIIEANFSCPNVDKKEGSLYMSASSVAEFSSKLVKAIHPLPLIIKVGVFSHPGQMRDCLIAAAKAGVRAVAGINTVSMHVVEEKGQPALGDARRKSGVCGGPIRNIALQFIEQAHDINRKEKLSLTLIGCGGITLPEHFELFLHKGADAATTATGMIWDPYLAVRYHQRIHK